MDPAVNIPQPAVTVVEISDPTATSADIELIDLDAMQLDALRLRARRVIVRLDGASVAKTHRPLADAE